MNLAVAAASGLAAAGLFAVGTALQYRSAVQVAATAPARVARATITSRPWLAGTAVLAVGLGLHAVALHEGPLTLVQPLLISAVLFALPASRAVGGPAVTLSDMVWAVCLVGALATFLVTATPATQASRDIDTGPALVTFAASLAGVGACVLGARRCRGTTRATVLGVAAGIALAGSAALIKVCTDLVVRGVGTLLASWQLYALVAVGVAALALSQIAYRSGPMIASLPAINTTNPLVSVVIGTGVFDERFRTGTAALGVEGVSLAVVLAATVALSRRSARAEAQDAAIGGTAPARP